ncbi:glycoside hydrolase family 9 protein [Roseimarinus sediminis]|uniref:glycoside hydrolase family 9 protein n=1 Tax=Roseimarinus sediminis TaxID=1610899 RepID=UPI003D24F0D1
MKNNLILSLLVMLLLAHLSGSAQNFHFNSLGYLPEAVKTAGVSFPAATFELVDAKSQTVVFEGQFKGPQHQDDVKTDLWLADLSAFKTPGNYQLRVDKKLLSPAFSIASDVYEPALKTSMRAFYLWRCGTAVEGEHNGITYRHEVCHTNDGYLDYLGDKGKIKDGTGGWHDAGDHGKYVVNAGATVGVLFMAWDHFNRQLNDFDFELPETAAGYPSFLKELKWETDWLLKMTYPDGSGRVSHKLTRTNFSGFIMPEDDEAPRYFTEWSSAATGSFVAMMAQAARYFKPYDADYAKRCLDAAMLSYKYLKEHSEYQRFEQGDFKTGGYQSHDADDRLWAAAELWETTGEQGYLDELEEQMRGMKNLVDENWDWGDLSNLGVFTYLLSEREGRDSELVEKASSAAIEIANTIVQQGEEDLFSRPLGNRYYWGCNGTVARQVMNLQVANKLQADEKYLATALNALHHLFGNNVYGRSFVTGLGHQPPMHPHDRRSGADNIEAPWPGYLVGGGQSATDWTDVEASYTTNEVAINWQAALVYALAGFVE